MSFWESLFVVLGAIFFWSYLDGLRRDVKGLNRRIEYLDQKLCDLDQSSRERERWTP